MGQKYDPKVEEHIREVSKVARDTGSSYRQAEKAFQDQREAERNDALERWREEHGKC